MSISKISGKDVQDVQRPRKEAAKAEPKKSFKEALESKSGKEELQAKKDPKLELGEARKTDEESGLLKEESGQLKSEKSLDSPSEDTDVGFSKVNEGTDLPKSDEGVQFQEEVDSKSEFAAELSPDEAVAMGLQPQMSAGSIQAPVVEATASPQAKHEVVERLIETMVTSGQMGEDSKGRKVLMMDVECPGRGNVRVRLWKKEDGIELRMRADNPELKSLLMLSRSDLQAKAKENGVNFSKIEVAQ